MSDDFEPDPPALSEFLSADTERVERLYDELRRVTVGHHAAYALSHAIACLHSLPAVRMPLHQADRDRLLSLLEEKRDCILGLFSDVELSNAEAGFTAVGKLIELWSCNGNIFDDEPDATTKADLKARTRWLRNSLHNLCLLREIEDRASQRTASTISDLKQLAMRLA